VDIFFILTNKRHPQQLKRLMRTPDMRSKQSVLEATPTF
jgi:hypothetical protein